MEMSEIGNESESSEAVTDIAQHLIEALLEKDGIGCDAFLRALVNIVNTSDPKIELGITLSVGGTQVSGKVISGDTYFELFSQAFATSFGFKDAATTESVRESINSYGVAYRGEQLNDPDRLPPNYIHIRDAKVFGHGGDPFPDNGSLWRGKLSSVNGFHLGTLSRSS
jgi:hypothetical protein